MFTFYHQQHTCVGLSLNWQCIWYGCTYALSRRRKRVHECVTLNNTVMANVAGHVLMDVLLPWYALQESFGEVSAETQMWQFWPNTTLAWSCAHQVRIGRISGKICERFYKIMTPLMSRHSLNRLDSILKPTCFKRLLVGMAMYSDDCLEGSHGRKQDSYTLCNHARQGQFWRFRQFTKSTLGVQDNPPSKQQVVIWKRERGRAINDLEPLAAKLRSTYQIPVITIDFAKISLEEQLRLIGNSTVHITPPGGGSHIAIYLPRGATTIRLYSNEFRLEWHIMHYLGYIHAEHVRCPKGKCVQTEVVGLVGEALERFETFG